jgi:hypothetical protein
VLPIESYLEETQRNLITLFAKNAKVSMLEPLTIISGCTDDHAAIFTEC